MMTLLFLQGFGAYICGSHRPPAEGGVITTIGSVTAASTTAGPLAEDPVQPNTRRPMASFTGTRAKKRRVALREDFWPGERAWFSVREQGYFSAPRTLPLIMQLLRSKDVVTADAGAVYLELLSRHFGDGIVEMAEEADHAAAAGFTGNRATRTWRDRMKDLETAGFIRVRQKGNRRYGYILLVHPAIAVGKLRKAGKVADRWWDDYRARQHESSETRYEELVPDAEPSTAEKLKTTASGGKQVGSK